MRSKARFFKTFAFCLLAAAIFLAAQRVVFSSLIDWTKHEEWLRQQMQNLLDEVKKNGSAKYLILSFRDYDTNHDGAIDKTEAKALEAELDRLNAAAAAKNKKA